MSEPSKCDGGLELEDGDRGVTSKRSDSPGKCYERLRPWIELANLPLSDEGDLTATEVETLRKSFVERSRTARTRTSLSSVATLLAQYRGQAQRLLSARQTIRGILDAIADRPSRLPNGGVEFLDESVPLLVGFEVNSDPEGRFYFSPDPLVGGFLEAAKGAEISRFRRCPICEGVFYALRAKAESKTDTKACSKQCNDALRARTWRLNQAKYQYARKLRSSGLKQKRKEKR